MPSVPVSVRASKKLGTAHGNEWRLLAGESGRGERPCVCLPVDSLQGLLEIPGAFVGRGHCQLSGDQVGGSCKDVMSSW